MIGGLEAAGTIASGIVAEPVAGLAGIAQALNPFAEQGAGAQAVKDVRSALTYEPKTEEGKQAVKSVGSTLAPVGEALEGAEDFLGDSAFELTGSPALAAAASSLPTAFMEAIGVGVGGRAAKSAGKTGKIKKGAVKSMLNEAAPDADNLKKISREIYKELDNSGIVMRPKAYEGMVNKVEKAARKSGLSKRTTRKAFGALRDMKDVIGGSPSITEIDDLRKVAQGVAGDIDQTEKALGLIMVGAIDDFLDNVSATALAKSDGTSINPANIGPRYKAARQLWGKARKSELVTEAIENAKTRASGFENGVRIELGKIAKNRKTKKYFSKSELDAIKDIEAGNIQQNLAKFIGRFAFNEGRANNMLSALGGVAGGASIGGPIGAVAVPVAGQISRGIAANLTKGRAQDLDTMIRSGKGSEDIVKAYLESVPKGKRNVSDLSNILSDPSIDLEPLFKSANKATREAAEIAAGRQIIGQAAGALAPQAVKEER
jgi:hypothetical protein